MARILVVEDDPLLRRSVHRLLVKAGHEVWETAGPQAAMALLSQTPMDVVVTDIHMPGMSGVELILQIDPSSSPKVIAMSGGGVSRRAGDALADAREAGAQRTIEKPFESRELIEAIEAVLRLPPEGAP